MESWHVVSIGVTLTLILSHQGRGNLAWDGTKDYQSLSQTQSERKSIGMDKGLVMEKS